ncbi:PiggyBac transposable element-derived protein 3 [Trichinella murrelli]|uniref:PiggyBac transposable element-derived protein 3 n=1 Tax=Trichinella murrelli TaxID=144512 RepID=A0A0V0UA51_9BILA|nr:PiggyBac transposable element-derived protein 3 [Trichinella murrelli]
MGGVDILDKLLSTYRPCLRSKKRWWNLFPNALNLAVVAAWRLHRELHQESSIALRFPRDDVVFVRKIAGYIVSSAEKDCIGKTRSGRNVGQIIVLPDPDVSEPDTVSEDELDRTFQQSHSSSDDEVIEEDDASANARRKSYIWCRRPFNPKTEAFIESDEEISPVLRSIEYFRIYFTPQLLSHISFETNRKATQCLYSNLVTTVAEMEGLIGMLITMGVSEMPRYRKYWVNQTRMDTVANCMSHNRFQTLFDNDKVVMDRSHPDYDRFYKIRSLIESIRKTCLEEAPGELQSVDEYIIPYKGRCKMKYYNPRKPDKWGLKVIAGCGKMDSYMTFGYVMEWRQK